MAKAEFSFGRLSSVREPVVDWQPGPTSLRARTYSASPSAEAEKIRDEIPGIILATAAQIVTWCLRRGTERLLCRRGMAAIRIGRRHARLARQR
jgi:hypothetical protein